MTKAGYLTIISAGVHNWNALVPELRCVITAPDRADLVRLTRESIAVAVEDVPGHCPRIQRLEQVSAGIRAELDGSEDITMLEPAPMNPVSLEIEAALNRAGITQAQLARRIGTSRSAVSRMVNPFYWGHSLELLRRVADATDTQVQLKLTARAS